MIIKYSIFIIAGLFLLLSLSVWGASLPSEWNSYCRKCHIDHPVNSLYDPSIKAHKTDRSCVACHRDKGIAGHVNKSAEAFGSLFQNITLPPDILPQKSSSVTSDECLRCHPYIFETDDISLRKLSKEARPIELSAGHGPHWDYRTFTPEQRDKMKSLISEKAKSPLTKTNQDLLDRLLQIEKMQCSRCHERFKKDSPGGIDPNINIAMKNPMECTACHIALRTAIHPGEAFPLPSAVSCERCHNGKLHQKMIFFPVDCGTKDDCLRCHPAYTPDKLPNIKPEQFMHKSTGMPTQKKIAILNRFPSR
jgi:hypothetical protein